MKKIMPWLDLLNDVTATDFPARRDRIAALMEQATEPTNNAAHLLAEAYVEGCKLEGDANAHWSIKEIEQAQLCSG
ncbi:stable inheritance protein KleA [Janthinobacterium sp. CG3]|uniref:stable inheritance protein KleA n=1 Tax=Janthinobacterium sp. CG3 TaxID=1075768 RepID=UPI000349BC7D|nr:stable inheritance protein KleA [Janthinobacterium sp. CG3]